MLCKLVLVLYGLCTVCYGAKILAFLPLPSKSNQAVYRPILKRLAERGHDVTYYSPFPMEDRPDKLKIVDVSPSLDLVPNSAALVDDAEQDQISYWQNVRKIEKIVNEAVHRVLVLPTVQELFRSDEKYDLLITSASMSQYCFLALAHKFNVSTVQIMPAGDMMWALEDVGASENPSYMVNFLSTFSDQMTFEERIRNTYHWVINRLIFPTMKRKHQAIMDKYIRYPGWEGRESIEKMASKTALYLINTHFSAGYLFPKPSNHKAIGGVNVVPSKPLPKEMKQFLDDAVNGAIYFSLGSIIKTSEVAGIQKIQKAFVNVFKKLNKPVLWKWENDVFPDKPPNVLASKWFPQQDILAHKNVKVFITQGGMISIFEAISCGVPLLGIPMYADQYKNTRHAVEHGYGIALVANNLTEASLQWALEEILNNPSYRKEAKYRAQLFHDRPLPPVDEATYWIEHVLKHGPVLRPISASLPFYKLYLLDVLGIILLAFTVLIIVVYKMASLLSHTLIAKIKRE